MGRLFFLPCSRSSHRSMRRLDVIGGHIAQSAALGTVDAGVPMPKGLQDVLAAIRAKKRFNARAWITDKAKKLVRVCKRAQTRGRARADAPPE